MNIKQITAAILTTAILAGEAVVPYSPALSFENMTAGAVGLLGHDWCGEKAEYLFTTDGCLYISGTGDMYDYESSSKTPWFPDNLVYHGTVKYIQFEGDIIIQSPQKAIDDFIKTAEIIIEVHSK